MLQVRIHNINLLLLAARLVLKRWCKKRLASKICRNSYFVKTKIVATRIYSSCSSCFIVFTAKDILLLILLKAISY